jgi:lipopolysaccharide export system protein LptA
LFYVLLLVVLAFSGTQAQQKQESDKVDVQIIHADVGTITQINGVEVNKLMGNVQLRQGETALYCDSAYFNILSNNVEAFGNVHIIQPETQVQSDYLRYTGNKKLAYLNGNVKLTDGKNTLWSEDLEYNVATKEGTYFNGGTLQADTTTVSSNTGTYNVRTKDARFRQDVQITDPQYNITSNDLGYNTESKLVRFFDSSIVTNQNSVLHTTGGTYDSKQQLAHFTSRSSFQDRAQYIAADTLHYDRISGSGYAIGHVVAIDTFQNTTLYCGTAWYHEKRQTMLAVGKPVLKKMNGTDSLFIRADTFYSAPAAMFKDSTTVKDTVSENWKNPKENTDSAALRCFIGYRHVRIFSDSLQGICDSIVYSQQDSILRMIRQPIVWSRKSQITGDTILLYTDSSRLKKMYIPNNALVVSQSGPDKALMFDQIQGKTLTGFFENNQIRRMVVWPNAESIYYAQDDSGAYLGLTEVQSERINVFFKDEAMDKILFEQDVKPKMTPMNQVNISTGRLSRFQWHASKRPPSRNSLFE